MEFRRQETEARSQKSEDRSQKTEARGQVSGGGKVTSVKRRELRELRISTPDF